MSGELFTLFAKIGLDSTEFNKGVDDTGKKTLDLKSKFGSLGEGVAKVGAGAAKAVAGIAAATTAAVAALGAGLVKAAKETAAFGDAIDKNSQRLGMSTEAYQKWDYVLSINGSSIESMGAGIKTLTAKIDGAKNGTEASITAFEKLGISMDDLEGKSREEIFELTIKGLQNVQDETEKAALANEFLGKSGQDLTPLLNTTNESIDELMDTAEQYGMVMSQEAVAASATFSDSLSNLSGVIKGVKNRLTAEFLPALTQVTDGLTALFTGDFSGVDKIVNGIDDIVAKFSEMLPRILEAGGKIAMALGQGLLDNLPSLFGTVQSLIIQVVDFIVDNSDKILDMVLLLIEMTAETLVDALPKLIDAFVRIVTHLLNYLTQNADKFVKMVLTITKSIADAIADSLPELTKAAFDLLVAIVHELLKPESLEMFVDIGGSLVDGIIKGLLEAGKGLLNVVVKLFGGIGDAVASLFGIHSPSKLFEDFGKYIDQGFAIGIKADASDVEDAMDELGEAVAGYEYEMPQLEAYEGMTAMNSIAQSLLQDVNVTVGFDVDELGVARKLYPYVKQVEREVGV